MVDLIRESKRDFLGRVISFPVVTVEGNDYRDCVDLSERYWANTKTGPYGKGIASNEKDPYKTARIGIAGEFAFAKLFNLNYSFQFLINGDDHDFISASGFSVNVKTKSYWFVPDRSSIRIGSNYALDDDMYVFCCVDTLDPYHDDREAGSVDIAIVGWLDREQVAKCPRHQSRSWKSNHNNIEVYFSGLRKTETIKPYFDGTI